MKAFILTLLLALNFGSARASTSLADQQRASEATISMLSAEVSALKATASFDKQRDPRCDDDRRPPVTCITRCIVRDMQGTCYSYGQDFCGVNPNCTVNCTTRGNDGRCYSYGPDICR